MSLKISLAWVVVGTVIGWTLAWMHTYLKLQGRAREFSRRVLFPLLLIALFAMFFPLGGCATAPVVAHPTPRAQAVAKCLAAEDASKGMRVHPACMPLAKDVAALRTLSEAAAR